jgi:hypothetical protein
MTGTLRRVGGVVVAGACAGLLVACATPVAGPSGNPSTGSGALGSAVTTDPPAQTPPATKAASIAECTVSGLTIVTHPGDASSGHRSVIIVFTNKGPATCLMQGYPGVAALDSHDKQIAQATRTKNGYLGGLSAALQIPEVDLARNESSSAMVEALAFNAGDGSACVAYAGLLVTPPDETHSVKVAWGSDGCSDLQIHPVVTGTSGRSQ